MLATVLGTPQGIIAAVGIAHGMESEGEAAVAGTCEHRYEPTVYHAFLHIHIVSAVVAAGSRLLGYLAVYPLQLTCHEGTVLAVGLMDGRGHEQTYGTR